MYHIKTESYHSETPLYTKLTSGPGTLFVPEARVAKDYFNTGLYESGYIDWPERCTDVPAKEIRKSLFDFIGSLGYKIVQVHCGTDDMFIAERP